MKGGALLIGRKRSRLESGSQGKKEESWNGAEHGTSMRKEIQKSIKCEGPKEDGLSEAKAFPI